jgi:hypothetical protein
LQEVDDEGKPAWDDDIDIGDIEGPATTAAYFLPGGEAYDPAAPGSTKERKRDRKGKAKAGDHVEIDELAGLVAANDEQAKKALDEYYEMEYEDVVRLCDLLGDHIVLPARSFSNGCITDWRYADTVPIHKSPSRLFRPHPCPNSHGD